MCYLSVPEFFFVVMLIYNFYDGTKIVSFMIINIKISKNFYLSFLWNFIYILCSVKQEVFCIPWRIYTETCSKDGEEIEKSTPSPKFSQLQKETIGIEVPGGNEKLHTICINKYLNFIVTLHCCMKSFDNKYMHSINCFVVYKCLCVCRWHIPVKDWYWKFRSWGHGSHSSIFSKGWKWNYVWLGNYWSR